MLIQIVDMKDWCIHIRIPAPGLELAKDDSRALREILIKKPVTFADPIDISGMGFRFVIVAPSCRLSNHGPVNLVEPDLI